MDLSGLGNIEGKLSSMLPTKLSGLGKSSNLKNNLISFMFRFMFANICFEKNENSNIYVMFIINIT